LEPYGPSFVKLIDRLEPDESLQIVRCATALEAVPIARHAGRCIVLAYGSNQESVIKLITMLKLLREGGGAKHVRSLITLQFDSNVAEAISEKLLLYGCSEVLREPVTDRALAFKIDRHVKSLPALNQKSIREPTARVRKESGIAPRESHSRSSLPPSEKNVPIKLVDSLTLESDCWLMRGGGVRKIGERWMIRFVGPGPVSGRWVEIENRLLDGSAGTERAWEWTPHDPTSDSFIVEQGAWKFHGSRAPEFAGEIWVFVGSQPSLEFVFENECYGAKFRLENGSLCIAKDSARALSQASAIAKTWHRKIKASANPASREAELNEQSETHFTVEAPKIGGESGERTEFAGEGGDEGAPFEMVDSLALESDFWLLAHGNVRRIRGTWLMHLKGPPRAACKWQEATVTPSPELRPAELEKIWQWVPLNIDADPYLKEEGTWLFAGLQPKFERGHWVFAGRRPRLDFVYEGSSYGAKVAVLDGGAKVQIAHDSKSAERALRVNDPDVFAAADGDEKSEDYVVDAEPEREIRDRRQEGEIEERSSDGSKRFGSDHGDVAEYRYPLSHFGLEGGDWEYVSEVGDSEKWNVFVPIEVTSGGIADVEKIQVYWIFRGRARPALTHDRTKWCFSEKPPYDVAQFVDLPQVIQVHLRSRVPLALNSAEGEADVPIVAEVRAKLSAPGASSPPGTLGALDDLQSEIRRKGKVPSAAAVSAQIQAGVQARAQNSVVAADVSGKPTRARVEFRAPSPPGPTLGPIAIAFLMSELLSNRKKFTLVQVAKRYTEYLSASCGGLRIELWVSGVNGWSCTATEDGSEGRFGGVIPKSAEPRSKLVDATTLVTLISSRNDGRLLGALVLAGDGAALVDPKYACAIADTTRGLMETLAGGDAQVAEAA